MSRDRRRERSGAPNETRRVRRIAANCSSSCSFTALFYPFQLSKTLIQLGYEPWPLMKGRAWYFFGDEKLYLPNSISYVHQLYTNYGLSAIYSGVGASICSEVVCANIEMLVDENLSKYCGLADKEENVDSASDVQKFLIKVIRGSFTKAAGVIVARPFHVVMIRKIARQIGGEDVYHFVFGSIPQIYNEEGIGGLFAGLAPQIIYELCVYWTVSSAVFLVDQLWKAYVEDGEDDQFDLSQPKTFKHVIKWVVPLVARSIFYPFHLVSTVMAVNGSGMAAGMPPFVPVYALWQDCFQDLANKNQLKRGAKMFFRFYEKPITYRHVTYHYAVPNA